MSKKSPFLFEKKNYIILAISILFICLGFILMIGGGGVDEVDFNPEIFSKQRIILAPIIIIAGYIGMNTFFIDFYFSC